MIFSLSMTISLAVMGGIIALENLFVCVLVVRFKELRCYTNGFVFSLSIADLLYGAVIIPLHIGIRRTLVHNYILALVLMANISTLVAVTLDRYLAVRHSLFYPIFMKRHFLKVVLISWAFPTGLALLPLIWGSDVTHKAQEVYLYCLIAIGIIIPYVLILTAYIIIFCTVRQHVRYLARLPINDQYQDALAEGKRVCGEARIARIFAVIAGIFVISWMPIVYMTLVTNMDRYDLIPPWLMTVSWITLSVGSLVNAPIYAFVKRDFRAVIRRLFRPTVSSSLQGNDAETQNGKFNVTMDVTLA